MAITYGNRLASAPRLIKQSDRWGVWLRKWASERQGDSLCVSDFRVTWSGRDTMTDAPVGARSLGLAGGFCMKEKPSVSSLLLVFNNNNRWYTVYLARAVSSIKAYSESRIDGSVGSNPLWPCGLHHTRLPCPSLSPGVCSNSSSWSWWCHPTISTLFKFNFLQNVVIKLWSFELIFKAPKPKVCFCSSNHNFSWNKCYGYKPIL